MGGTEHLKVLKISTMLDGLELRFLCDCHQSDVVDRDLCVKAHGI